MPRSSLRARLAPVLVVTGLLSAAVACELAIPASASFACDPGADAATVCPQGSACSPAGQCVAVGLPCGGKCAPPATCDVPTATCIGPDGAKSGLGGADATVAGNDGGVAFDGQPNADGAWAGDGGCAGFGCPCTTTADCTGTGPAGEGLACVGREAITADIWDAAGAPDASICMQACCTSSDCTVPTADGGIAVCFATGAGGNYCVPPDWLPGRVVPTSAATALPGGHACGGDAGVCRSGLCLGDGLCADTCCSNRTVMNECASNSCRFGPFPGSGFDTHESAHCAAPVTGMFASSGGMTCMSDTDCRSGLCVDAGGPPGMTTSVCRDACRIQADCTSLFQTQVCGYLPVDDDGGTELAAACMPQQGGGPRGDGGAGGGAACRVTSDCKSGYCVSGLCLSLCATDDDCLKPDRCRPQPLALGAAAYSVLGCGP